MSISIENIKSYMENLHHSAPQNLMIPVIVAILGAIILLRNKF